MCSACNWDTSRVIFFCSRSVLPRGNATGCDSWNRTTRGRGYSHYLCRGLRCPPAYSSPTPCMDPAKPDSAAASHGLLFFSVLGTVCRLGPDRRMATGISHIHESSVGVVDLAQSPRVCGVYHSSSRAGGPQPFDSPVDRSRSTQVLRNGRARMHCPAGSSPILSRACPACDASCSAFEEYRPERGLRGKIHTTDSNPTNI